MSAFIDAHRERFGVELICRTLDVSASAYHQRASGERSAREIEHSTLSSHRSSFAASRLRYSHNQIINNKIPKHLPLLEQSGVATTA